MAVFRVYFQTGASTSVDVEVPDEVADSEDFDIEDVIDRAYDADRFPTICAQCSGWGGGPGLDIGEWELSELPEGRPDVDRL